MSAHDKHAHGNGHGHHHHGPGHHHHHHHAGRNIGIAFLLNFGFAIIEFIGGMLTGSIAIQSDAVHDLGDSITLGFAYILEKFSQRRSSPRYSYGFRRLSLVSALLTSLILVVGSIYVLTEAIARLSAPTHPKVEGMIGLALLGVGVNGYAAWRVRHGSSLNERVISWHLIEDVLGWAAILIASIVMYFADVPILDPLLSIGISCFILWNVFKSLKATLRLFLQAAPQDMDLEALKTSLLTVPRVTGIHDLHMWSLDGESHVVTVHAVLAAGTDITQLSAAKAEIRHVLETVGKVHATIEMEIENEFCSKLDCVTS